MFAFRTSRRPRRPLPGRLLHLDGSCHQWFQDERWYDLIGILNDATSEVYYAQLVEEGSTRTVVAALQVVIMRQGRFLRAGQRPRPSLLRDAEEGWAGRSAPADPGGSGAQRVGDSDDPG